MMIYSNMDYETMKKRLGPLIGALLKVRGDSVKNRQRELFLSQCVSEVAEALISYLQSHVKIDETDDIN